MDSPRRSVVPVVLVAGVAGVAAWALLRTRAVTARTGGKSLSAERPTTPLGRYGEPGPEWEVVETLPVARPAGEVAQHLHDHGGLPGLTGGRQGPVMDRIEWDVEGAGHFEAEVHALPGAHHTELTVRVAPQHGGARGAAEWASAALGGGGSIRVQVSRSLSKLQRLLESTAPGSPERAAGGAAAGTGVEHRGH